MKNIYLTSEFSKVSKKVFESIRKNISKDRKLKAVFITTAYEEKENKGEWYLKDRKSLEKEVFEIQDYSVTNKNESEIRKFIKKFDIIFIEGGNTFRLLEKTLESGFSDILKEVLEEKIFIGQSAGSVIMGNSVSLKSNPPKTTLKNFDGLKVINATIIPHWGRKSAERDKKNLFEKMYKHESNIILLKDDSYIFTDGKKIEIYNKYQK